MNAKVYLGAEAGLNTHYFVVLQTGMTRVINFHGSQNSLEETLQTILDFLENLNPQKIQVFNGQRVRASGEIVDCGEIPPSLIEAFLTELRESTVGIEEWAVRET